MSRPRLTTPPPDAEIARLDEAIANRAAAFYAALPAKGAPDCGYDANATTYAALRADAAAMEQRAAPVRGDGAMQRAASALSRTLSAAELSHQRASASTGDRFGICMAPDAIALNADAIARATKAIGTLQDERSH